MAACYSNAHRNVQSSTTEKEAFAAVLEALTRAHAKHTQLVPLLPHAELSLTPSRSLSASPHYHAPRALCPAGRSLLKACNTVSCPCVRACAARLGSSTQGGGGGGGSVFQVLALASNMRIEKHDTKYGCALSSKKT